ncbi:MAG: cytochrome C [Rhodomicrobiaceae bacterium]
MHQPLCVYPVLNWRLTLRELMMVEFVRYFAIAVIACTMTGRQALAQEPGDILRGYDFARQICAKCHAIEKGERTSPNPRAPTFEKIARTPGMTPTALAVFLHTPHASMPNLILSDDELGNIAAYVTSLK